MVKPGVTEELRTRAGAHMAEAKRRRLLTMGAVLLALAAVAFLVLRAAA